jgi:hypothetical protein
MSVQIVQFTASSEHAAYAETGPVLHRCSHHAPPSRRPLQHRVPGRLPGDVGGVAGPAGRAVSTQEQPNSGDIIVVDWDWVVDPAASIATPPGASGA